MAYSILIIKIGALGDVLRTTFLLKGLKEKYRGCSISWITSELGKELLKNNPFIDNVYGLSEKDKLPDFFNLVLSLDDEREAAEIATKPKKDKMGGAYVESDKVKYTKDSAEWFDMGLLRPDERGGKKEADRLKKENKKTYQEILASIVGIPYNCERPILNLTDKEKEFGKRFMDKNGLREDDLIIGVNTGAGKRWKLKSWSADSTVKLINLLIDKIGTKVILLGGKNEDDRNREIIEKADRRIVYSGCENSLREFASIIDTCGLLVTSDTLAMHMGLALEKKVIVLMGPTSNAEINVYGKGKKIYADIDCLCCYKKECDIRPNCMDLISVEKVFEIVKEQLNKK